VTARWGAPAPDGVRHLVRAGQHPARAVECPHCEAHEHRPCTTKSKRRRLEDAPVHPGRITAWVRQTAVCPTCQVEPGVQCHEAGWPQADNHPARIAEAEGAAA
jgi:hypothetical protein